MKMDLIVFSHQHSRAFFAEIALKLCKIANVQLIDFEEAIEITSKQRPVLFGHGTTTIDEEYYHYKMVLPDNLTKEQLDCIKLCIKSFLVGWRRGGNYGSKPKAALA